MTRLLLVMKATAVALVMGPFRPPMVNGADFCDLRRRCTREMAPVCGSNGITYENRCRFETAKCKDTTLTIRATGECLVPTTTATPATACEMVCLDQYEPVCGSDGKTYANDCSLRLADCQQQRSGERITVAAQGECAAGGEGDGPGTPQPDRRPVITVGPDHEPEPEPEDDGGVDTVAPMPADGDADCEMACTFDYAPVCGSNGKTYSNACALRVANCRKRPAEAITVASDGECPQDVPTTTTTTPMTPTTSPGTSSSCARTACMALYKPVCGSDGQTYTNECELGRAKCRQPSADLHVVSEGACAGPVASNSPTSPPPATPTPPPSSSSSSCPEACTREFKPVCGSDGQTYTNQCEFNVAKCTKRIADLTFTDGACARRLRVKM